MIQFDRVPRTVYQFDDVVLNPEAFCVEKAGRPLALEPKSIRLLLYLIQNRSRAIGKDELLREIWEDAAVTDNALARVVAQLRKALGDDVKVARYIETVPTIGYRFVAEVVERTPEVPAAALAPTPAAPVPAAPARAPEKETRQSRWPVALGLVALPAVVTAAAFWLGGSRAPEPVWSGTVLGGPIIASHPRLSPDGQLLAFRAIVDGQSQVAVMKPDSSSWTALTNDRTKGAMASVAWARDGSRIYFDREWGPGRIYSIGPLGGEPRLVLENAWLPEPLPDGSLIVDRPTSMGHQQLLRFWPDSGRTQTLPATVRFFDSPNVRAFPDGREIAVFGFPSGSSGQQRLFALDLQTLAVRNLVSDAELAATLRDPIAVSPDGRWVLIQRRRNDTVDTIAVPRSGTGPPHVLVSLPGVAAPISQDVGADGSIYMDHSEFERAVLSLTPAGVTLAEIPVPQLAEGGGQRAAIALPGGAVIFDVQRHGHFDLYIGRKGAEPQRLLNSPESASLPGALLGTGRLAFILGAPDQPRIAIASLDDGHVTQRFPTDAHWVTSITAPADGRTIYYATMGVIWAQPVDGGEPRKIGEGYDIAIEPAGKFLYVMRTGPSGYQLFRMPAAGGEATQIPIPAGFHLTPLPLAPAAIDAQGRVLLPVNVLDLFFYRTAILDPARNTVSMVPAPPRLVVTSAGWSPEGNLAARVAHWSSSLWRYRTSLQNQGVR